MGKGKPFLELFASALHEDYRVPILETFAFLYTLGTFVVPSMGGAFPSATSGEAAAFDLVTSMTGLPLFIFFILMLKNLAYGLGTDLEKGVLQTLLSYPVKRYAILTAKLLSALGVALLLFLGIQMSAFYILAPDIILPYFSTVLLTYAASLSYSLLIAGIMLLVTLVLKRGGLALVLGIVLYFLFGILSGLTMFLAFALESPLPLQILSVLSPSVALHAYYHPAFMPFGGELWSPSFWEALAYVGTGYVTVIFLFLLGYFYFDRRLSM
ncbi:MAG: ABC transporter permease subunit [Thermoproteota archaeon]|nr:ABC transporter permease subunit [Thermoproteota archaeon]